MRHRNCRRHKANERLIAASRPQGSRRAAGRAGPPNTGQRRARTRDIRDAALQPRRDPVEQLVGAHQLQRGGQHIVHLPRRRRWMCILGAPSSLLVKHPRPQSRKFSTILM